MEDKIDYSSIEKKWQKIWDEKKVFEVKEGKDKKFYILEMFPYPSGAGLHMGHAFNYTIGDIFARYKIMNGFNVLHPAGYDSLGLPAENAAIKNGTHPQDYTQKSIKNFIKQQKALGLTYDWTRVLNTSDSSYYKWDQWIFLKMMEKGLAYRKKSAVNWCPKCETVLANEQVQQGKCWRHEDTDVEVKHLDQWYFKITDYVEELNDFSKLEKWPELIKKLQSNWIGKSYGTEINFKINSEDWKVFTTRPDTIYGVTFVVVSAQHPRLTELVTKEQKKEVDSFLKRIRGVSEKELESLEKEGVFTGSYAINPLTNERIPVYAGNFVVADYGAGMVMAVPAHDQRDFEFAKKYNIPVKIVIQPKGQEVKLPLSKAYTSEGVLTNSGIFDGTPSKEAIQKITDYLEQKKLGKRVVNYKLRDWLISRQRYWGTPIPIVYCDKCGIVPVKEKDLPVELPKNVKFGNGNPLETAADWVNTKCPKCSGKARRETDTMDTFVNSSWYQLRFADANNDKEIFSKKKAEYWNPIDLYIGGKEHACMHLIYFRFYNKFLRDLGIVKSDEPAIRLFNQGYIYGSDGRKMSKSLGNTVEPLQTIETYGADTLRMYLISSASPDSDYSWNDKEMQGTSKFVNRLMQTFDNIKIGKSSKRIETKLNLGIKEITENIELLKYNLAVIKLRELYSVISEEEISKEDLKIYLKLLAPFCPHICEELYEKLGGKGLISTSDWPTADETKIDMKIEEAERVLEKTISDISNILKLVKEKSNINPDSVYLYVLPQELKNYDANGLSKKTGKEVKVFAVNDKDKYDPENKSQKAKPGKPAIFVE
jgi:leucyl-tRNA synthetase